VAGVEVYTLELSLELMSRGHQVTVLHATRGPGLTQYDLIEGDVQGLPVFRMVQNYPYRPMDEIAVDPQAERRFEEVVRRVKPHVVHFQHLWGWSAALPGIARDRGIRSIVHLHDHWLVCPSGGQRFHPDGSSCEDLDNVDCDACYSRFRSKEGPLERLALRAARRVPPPFPPDLLHRTFAAAPPAARALLKRMNRRRGSGVPADTVLGARERRALYLDALAVADAHVAPSRDLARRMEALGYSRIHHVANGTALDCADAPLPGLAEPDSTLSLLFLGTPLPHKGVHVLAEAVARIAPRACLKICGHRPDPNYMKQLDRKGVEWVEPISREDVGALIDTADLLCLPSLWPENAPLVLLEARARRRPVLASETGGIPEMAQGRLLAPGDVDAWTETIGYLASQRDALAKLAAAIEPPPTAAGNATRILKIYRGLAP